MSEDLFETGGDNWRARVRQAARAAAEADPIAVPSGGVVPEDIDAAFNYRWEHVKAVVRLAQRLAELTGADAEIVEAAAWLHDIAKENREDHGQAGAIEARRVLLETDFPPDKVPDVAAAIAKHVGLVIPAPVEPLEAAVLWDADKLTKIGATAILLHTGHRVTAGLGTIADLLASLPKPILPDIVDCLHTEPARAAGRKRLLALRLFWQQAIDEFEGDDLVI